MPLLLRMRKEMHQWIKAALCQEMKQMTPSPLEDKDVSGKRRKTGLKLAKSCQCQYLILITGPSTQRSQKGHPPPTQDSKTGHPVILDGGRVLITPHSNENRWGHVCGTDFHVHEWGRWRACCAISRVGDGPAQRVQHTRSCPSSLSPTC